MGPAGKNSFAVNHGAGLSPEPHQRVSSLASCLLSVVPGLQQMMGGTFVESVQTPNSSRSLKCVKTWQRCRCYCLKVFTEKGRESGYLTENDTLHSYCKALAFNVWSVNRSVGIGSRLTRSVYSILEPGKCLWLFLQAEFWCLGVWAMDQQDVPAGGEWPAHSQLARLGAVAAATCPHLLTVLLEPTHPTLKPSHAPASGCLCCEAGQISSLILREGIEGVRG